MRTSSSREIALFSLHATTTRAAARQFRVLPMLLYAGCLLDDGAQ
jgi:hypothetical protein